MAQLSPFFGDSIESGDVAPPQPPPAAISASRHPVGLPQLWTAAPLPSAWPDQPRSFFRLLRWFLRLSAQPYELAAIPPDLSLHQPIPSYAREAFHGMPNGYYSRSVVEGYDRGFELAMLGRVQRARERMVGVMGKPRRALDIGCGTGRLASAMCAAGVEDVWGIDPSPYMLQRAVERAPQVRFVQGVMETSGFPDDFFDAAGACFLFHELPAAIARVALEELRRVLRPGGVLCITDPCRDHLAPPSRWKLLRRHGWSALYFHALARFVYEPFVADWHGIDNYDAWLSAHGFELIEHHVELPFSQLVARKR